ncbi:MAG TPA: hypothetical protein PKD49_05210 [Hyphomicrobium sp.]|nr:hypothetical protein [Hyphomicrobium sp.]
MSVTDVARVMRPEGWMHAAAEPRYTIATLVSDRAQYDAMRASFRPGGFADGDCEYLFIDNTGARQIDAYRGLNALLNAARAPIVILCHQDVRLLSDGRDALDARLSSLSQSDADWAVAGNAGGVAPGQLALRISDPHGRDVRVGELPAKVTTLDENFLVVRRDARIGFSNDLSGFHFYGADICLHARQMGYSAYVIDFHLEHLSAGKKGVDFGVMEQAFQAKWGRALSARWLQTTCALMRLSGAPGGNLISRIASKPVSRIVRRLPSARGWSRAGQSTP